MNLKTQIKSSALLLLAAAVFYGIEWRTGDCVPAVFFNTKIT